jgi:hypothetical protein
MIYGEPAVGNDAFAATVQLMPDGLLPSKISIQYEPEAPVENMLVPLMRKSKYTVPEPVAGQGTPPHVVVPVNVKLSIK